MDTRKTFDDDKTYSTEDTDSKKKTTPRKPLTSAEKQILTSFCDEISDIADFPDTLKSAVGYAVRSTFQSFVEIDSDNAEYSEDTKDAKVELDDSTETKKEDEEYATVPMEIDDSKPDTDNSEVETIYQHVHLCFLFVAKTLQSNLVKVLL